MKGFCFSCKHTDAAPSGPICSPCLAAWSDDNTSPGWTPAEPSENRTVTKEDTKDCTGNCSDCGHKSCIKDAIEVHQKSILMPSEADPVSHPGHYTSLPLEAIKTIKLALTEAYGEEGFEAYCFGNELKYRLRAGFKGDAAEDINKALKYAEFRKGNFE